ncbi:MAG: hypothetical protein JWN29_4262 [Acidimicrobiales bacterium]|nr:hypothetical protein [Acidimicrobiales bacterium]
MDIDRQVAGLSTRQHGAFAVRQLQHVGIDHRARRRRIEAGRWEVATDRVLRLAGVPPTAEQLVMIGVLHLGPPTVASHEAAAWLWGLPGFAATTSVSGTRTHGGPVDVSGHRPRLILPSHCTEVRGIPCTTLPRTIFDLAGLGLHPGRMERLVDNVITKSPAMLPALHRTLDELAQRGRPGITIMRQILDNRTPGTKVTATGLEARVLELARNAGIRELEPQVDVGGHSWLGRVDFAILRLRLLIEVDSVLHHTSKLDRANDEARDAAMRAAGWRKVLRITEEDVWRQPWLVVDQLRQTIRELEMAEV